jgi:hypothetical protein
MFQSLMWSSSGLSTRYDIRRVIAYKISWRHYSFVKPLFVNMVNILSAKLKQFQFIKYSVNCQLKTSALES